MNTVNQMKNMIVLRDLPSNIIEEAFVVLKPNKRVKVIKSEESSNNENSIANKQDSEYIVREAEMVISKYLSDIEDKNKIRNRTIQNMEAKYKRLKKATIVLGVMLAISVIFFI